MSETKTTETERITRLVALHKAEGDRLISEDSHRQAARDLAHADTLERFALPLAQEVDHLREQSHAEHLFNCEIREAMGFYSDAVTDEQVIEAVRKMRKGVSRGH